MKLDKKKRLAARALGVGIGRIAFNKERLDEIKEAITRQDIKELEKSRAIKINLIKGRKTNIKKNTRRKAGNVRIKVKNRKQDYVKITRKLRTYVKELKKQGALGNEKYKELRKQIKNKKFKSKKQLKENLE
ncbi:MAG: 50S ribosomal protein L19e [Candidatus Pacearchaeota archaeon]